MDQVCPLTHSASSLRRNAAAAARSAGRPRRVLRLPASPAAARGQQVRDGQPAAVGEADQVHLERAAPDRRVHAVERDVVAQRGGGEVGADVEDAVEPAGPLDGALDQPLDGRLVGEVELDRDGVAPRPR
jgi:hypothetical protein